MHILSVLALGSKTERYRKTKIGANVSQGRSNSAVAALSSEGQRS